MLTRVFLIRHGRTAWNKERRYCGCLNVGLSNEGKAQARKLRLKLKSNYFDRIYCSVQKRALETAHIVFDGAKMTRVAALREINFGVLEGMHYKDIMLKYGPAYEGWIRDPYRNRIPGSEPTGVFKKRVVKAIKDIVRCNPGKTVAIICHGGVIGTYVSSIRKSRSFWRYVPKSSSVTVVRYGKGSPRILKFNDITHLG